MEQQLYRYLQFEQQLLQELVRLATRQQTALANYNIAELEEITSFQNELIKNVRIAEEKRIDLLMSWMRIGRRDAVNLKLSLIKKHVENPDISTAIRELQKSLRSLIEQLQVLNTTNRLLTNRARTSIKEMMEMITGGNSMCNVKI